MKLRTVSKFSAFFLASCFLIGAGALVILSAQSSYEIVPRVRVGAITSRTSESDLKSRYGRKNVQSTKVHLGEGEYEPGTVIYPNDPTRTIEIIWKDAQRKRFPKRIQISGEKSVWRTRHGISLGTELKELERINGKPFVLAGFNWDYGGTVVSWEGGKLERDFEKDGRVVVLRLSYQTDHDELGIDAGSVKGDRDFPSSNQVMQKINPKVYQIIVAFP